MLEGGATEIHALSLGYSLTQHPSSSWTWTDRLAGGSVTPRTTSTCAHTHTYCAEQHVAAKPQRTSEVPTFVKGLRLAREIFSVKNSFERFWRPRKWSGRH